MRLEMMRTMMTATCSKKVNTNVKNCARCGQSHDNIDFQPFTISTNLYDSNGDGSYTHWALCPTNGEPILFT